MYIILSSRNRPLLVLMDPKSKPKNICAANLSATVNLVMTAEVRVQMHSQVLNPISACDRGNVSDLRHSSPLN